MMSSREILGATCQANTLSTLMTALRMWDIDSEPILASAGLTAPDLNDAERRISVLQFRDVWDAAREATGDDALGLHVIEAFDPADVLSNVVFYMATSSATPREAFERVSPFIQLSHEAIEIDLVESDGQTICRMGYRGLSEHRTLTEYLVGLVVKIAPSVVGANEPFKVSFKFPPPRYAEEYSSIFGIKVEFNAPYNALIGAAANMDRPLPNADAILCSMMERQATEALARLPARSSFAENVRSQIEESLLSGDVTAEGIARSLGLSGRTLRRRLGECDVSYQVLLDEVRCEFARQALMRPGASVSEVAYQLGFSDTSAFHKAFRRWTGHRPSDVKNQLDEPKP